MTIEQLIAAAKRTTLDEERIAAFQRTVDKAEAIFEERAERRAVTEEVLARTCSL